MATAELSRDTEHYSVIVNDTREDWLRSRETVIGASESAAIIGEGYEDQTPHTIWESKIKRMPTKEAKKRLEIGLMMEPALRSIFTYETGIDLAPHRPNELLISKKYPYMGASLDSHFWDAFTIPVELKNVDYFQRHEWADGATPLKYEIQVTHQCIVTGAPYGYILGLIGGNDPQIRRIEVNKDLAESLVVYLRMFWKHVENKTLPPMNDFEATGKVLNRLWKPNGETIVLPDEALQLDKDLQEAKEAKKKAIEKEIAAENRLKALIGENTYAALPGGGSYSWKEQSRAGYSVAPVTFRVLKRHKV